MLCCFNVRLDFTALTISGCQKQKQVGPLEIIIIAYTTNLNPAFLHIVFVKSFFTEDALDTTPQPHPFGKVALQGVIDEKADIAIVEDTSIVFAVMNGKKITTLATIRTLNRNDAIIARRGRGITLPSLSSKEKHRPYVGHFHCIDKKQVKIIKSNLSNVSSHQTHSLINGGELLKCHQT